LRAGRPRGPRKILKNVGGFVPPTDLKAFPGPRGRPDLKTHPKKPGQTAFRYPGHEILGILGQRTLGGPKGASTGSQPRMPRTLGQFRPFWCFSKMFRVGSCRSVSGFLSCHAVRVSCESPFAAEGGKGRHAGHTNRMTRKKARHEPTRTARYTRLPRDEPTRTDTEHPWFLVGPPACGRSGVHSQVARH
jgi:hypothetical protein